MPVIKTQVAVYRVRFYGNYSCYVPPDGLLFCSCKNTVPGSLIIPSQITRWEGLRLKVLSLANVVGQKPHISIFQLFMFSRNNALLPHTRL